MSKFSGYAKKSEADYNKHKDEQVVNFMNGISYKTNPLLELEMVAASSIFGEKSYYKNDGVNSKELSGTTATFVEACDNALTYDFEGVLKFAKKLRYEYNMRLNPALIMVRAVMHDGRKAFNEENKVFMRSCIEEVINIPTDIWNQFELWMFFNGSKNKLPSILKRAWANKLSTTKKYQLAKYKTSAKIIDLVRICHAHSEDIDELMKSGTIEVTEEESTWEKLRSAGKTWTEILQATYVPHMALLKNLRGIFTEVNGTNVKEQVLKLLEDGVEKGKQFPFRYWSALKSIKESNVNFKSDIEDSLNRCLDKSMANFPKLNGKTICLSDNSGSAWGALTTEYGSTKVAEIDNLSSVMTAINSDEGYVGIFGDRLEIEAVNKRDGVLSQLDRIQIKHSHNIGGSTENGIWLFFDEAIKKKIHYDNIFIYSDQQAGHGGLYGLNEHHYRDYLYRNSRYIDVLKLVQEYRRKVNAKVNIFSIQTAGYNNNIMPENEYRTSILTGWTGKESIYAKTLIDIWDKMDNITDEKVEEKTSIKIKTSVND